MADKTNKENKNLKQFKISSLSISNVKTIFLIAIVIAVAGMSAYSTMPKENFPELQIPEVYVGTAYPGASPEFVEDKITKPFEDEINGIKGIDEVNSTSINGYSSIQVKFDFEVTPTEGLRKVKDAVDKVMGEPSFPQDLPAEPNIFEMDISQLPIMNINLSGDYSRDQLKEYGEFLEEKIEALSEITAVDIRGVQEKEMRIHIKKHRAESKNVSFSDIESAIQNENLSMSGGELLSDGVRRTIKIDGEFSKDPKIASKEIGELVVKREKMSIVYMKEVADISFGDADVTSYARELGNPVVMLDIKKRSGQNLLIVSGKIFDLLEEAKEDRSIPENVKITVTNDQSYKTRDQVSNLENSIIFGVILVVLVLLFFLGLRNALFVGIAIPMSMFMSFMILNAMGVTLNVMVLFSLVLALGMLVDNGIVVVENIYRFMDEGMDGVSAAKYGVGEVAWPIIASTATTLAAFVPLALWPGMMGEFMKYIPITLMIVLGSSLFVALVINPVFTALYMKVEKSNPNVKRVLIVSVGIILLGILFLGGGNVSIGNILILLGILIVLNMWVLDPLANGFQNKVLPRLEKFYKNFLIKALSGRKPIMVVLGTFVLFVMSIVLVAVFQPKVEFFPVNQPNYVNIFITHPIGTDIEETNKTTKEIEEILFEFENKYHDVYGVDKLNGNDTVRLIKSIIAQVGEGTSDPAQGVSMGNTPHKGRITISFAEFQFRNGYLSSDLMNEIRNNLVGKFNADIEISAEKNNEGPPLPPPINIEVTGEGKYENILVEAEKIRTFLVRKGVKGVAGLKLDVENGKPELPIEIDRRKARALNLSTGQIASSIRTALFGKDIGKYKTEDDDYDINIRYKEEYRYDLDALLDQKITFRNNMGKLLSIPIRSVVYKPKNTSTYSAVKRKDLERVVTVYSNVIEGLNGNEIVAEIKSVMKDYQGLTPGYEYAFTGQQEDQAKEMEFLSGALLLAVALILAIIVTQFNSFSTPAIILIAVVFSLIGVFLGLVIFQMDFIIIMTMIGIISLAGIVVNNAIVLIDYINLIRRRKRDELGLTEEEQLPMNVVVDSIIEGGKTRLRPVLLTAITTILGLYPMAKGLNINFVTLMSDYDPQFYIGGDNVMFFGPMSWTIIFGLTFATFLTLVIVPVLYLLLYRMKLSIYRLFNMKLKSNI